MTDSIEFTSSTIEALRSDVDEASIKALIPSLVKGTITMLFSDIVNSTPLKRGVGAEERYFTEIKPRHDGLLKSKISQLEGYILNVIGDSFFAGFQSAKNAVQCAYAIQDALSQYPIPTQQGPFKLRIGVHTGEPEVYKNVLDRYDLCGSDVDRAARVETLSGAEQVLLSPQTKALAEELEGLRFHSHSRFYLKGLGWSEVFELLWNGREPRRPHGSSQDRYPGPRSDFVGRTRELGELRKRLNESRLVTLTGPGGMGKIVSRWRSCVTQTLNPGRRVASPSLRSIKSRWIRNRPYTMP